MVTRLRGLPSTRAAATVRPGKPATVLVVHGPNLNLLGEREPEIYGRTRLVEIDRRLRELGKELALEIETFQSNSEGAIIDRLQQARGRVHALMINPAGYTHTSVAIRDAVLALDVPVVEVHLSNIYRRERFRHRSILADAVHGRIMGFGPESYMLGLRAIRSLVEAARGAGA